MARKLSKKSTLQSLSFDYLLCRAFLHSWLDKDMLPMIWGAMKVEQWNLECDRCRSTASEYRDPVTCERVGQRQYQLAPGYSMDYKYDRSEIFQEISRRRKAEKRAARAAARQAAS
jgi:hypothetical protein